MRKILMATTNQAKIDQIGGALDAIGVTVIGVANKNLLPEVAEDGETALENARIKAQIYAKALGRVVLSMDNTLFFDRLIGDPRQPGMNVRRIPGFMGKPTDEQMIEYYSQLVEELGGSAQARWEYGICIASPDEIVGEVVLGYKTTFVSQPSKNMIAGYPLESLQRDEESGKYRSEMTKEELAQLWQRKIGKPLSDFVNALAF
jgi:inosine/xanthosine triphosphate pyrophosphatase family protein